MPAIVTGGPFGKIRDERKALCFTAPARKIAMRMRHVVSARAFVSWSPARDFIMFALFFGPFILIVGAMAFASGVSHAVSPRESKLVTLKLLTRATSFAAVTTVFAGICNAFKQVADGTYGADSSQLIPNIAGGVAESMVGAMVGFSFLSVAWLAATVGSRKMYRLAEARSPASTEIRSSMV